MNVIYIVDDNNKLVDDLRIREILLAPLHAHVADLMDNQFVSLCVTDGRKKAVEVFGKYDRTALPVVDTQGRMAGILTLDDVLDVAEEEATRDLQRFGGLEALDDPYMSTPLPAMIRKRASWLVVLFVGEMLTATAMGFFEHQISRAVVLALFVPLIISSGGNSGSQAATLIIRALALGEVKLKDWWRVMRREIVAGILLGCILGTIGFIRIAAWHAFSSIYGPHWFLVGFDSQPLAHRRRRLGNLDRVDAPVSLATIGLRSRNLIGAVRRDARRRHRADHLLHLRHHSPSRHAILTALPALYAEPRHEMCCAWLASLALASPDPSGNARFVFMSQHSQ